MQRKKRKVRRAANSSVGPIDSLDQHSSFRRDSRGGCTPHKKGGPNARCPPTHPYRSCYSSTRSSRNKRRAYVRQSSRPWSSSSTSSAPSGSTKNSLNMPVQSSSRFSARKDHRDACAAPAPGPPAFPAAWHMRHHKFDARQGQPPCSLRPHGASWQPREAPGQFHTRRKPGYMIPTPFV